MGVSPIDLQTMFSQLEKISKTQVQQTQAAQLQSNLVQEEIARKETAKKTTVEEASPLPEGQSGVVKRRNESNQSKNNGKDKEKENEDTNEENKEEPVFFKDPSLGQKIDIMG